MKKIFSLITVILAALVLVACESDNRTKIVFWHTMGKTAKPEEGGQALLEAFIKEWEALPENKEYRIVHVSKGGYGELNSAVGTAISAGNEPHLTYSYNDHVAGYLRRNVVQPLDELINDPQYGLSPEEIADFVPGYWAEGKTYDAKGTLYSLPFSKSTEAMFYNKTFFTENGLEVPVTWDDVRAVGEAIKAKSEYADKKYIPVGYDSPDNLFITASAQRKAPYTNINANGQGEILFNNEQSKAMVEYFRNLYFDGLFTTKDQLGGSNTSNKFVAGEIFMSIGSTGGTKYNIPGNENPFDVGVAPIPQFDVDNRKMIQQGPNINLFKNRDQNQVLAAWRFLKYITDTDQTARWSMASGYSPVRLSAFENETYKTYLSNPNNDKKQQVFIDVLKLAQSQSNYFFTSAAFDKSAKTRQEVGTIFSKAFEKDANLDSIFAKAYQEVIS
ncbi:ABC-type transport system, substrate-binding component [Alteracholeplasma palmae J233]|uniref:ABC-type transport system, substrate-binding component n=1 Tax=Alteracholeplasma palmae (strain ATCC 49389 / J233) TaxID=1318466 RepID=U4KLZ2_ALTPJ|nr:extracellular solute-binding protein [Alteracholeplasma palmae]CCV64997.1 ABC-type transport system, substrate-binding component [Alteracholeplasma palmae J233]